MIRHHNEQSEIPSGYQEVKCLVSQDAYNVNKWIDTRFVPNQDTRMQLDIYMSKACSRVAGCENISLGNGKFRIGGGARGLWYTGYDGYSYVQTRTIILGRHLVDVNKNVFSIDGTVIYTYPYTTFTGYGSIWLFMVHSDSMSDYAAMKLYSCKIWDNGALVRDYKPVIRLSDNKPGIYDLVNCVFDEAQGNEILTYETL